MRDWTLGWDMNHDGVTTITDIALFLKSLFFYPGDLILEKLIGSGFGQFFEMTHEWYGGFLSGFTSFICWSIVLFLTVGVLIDCIRKLD